VKEQFLWGRGGEELGRESPKGFVEVLKSFPGVPRNIWKVLKKGKISKNEFFTILRGLQRLLKTFQGF